MCFDAWVKPGPREKNEMHVANPREKVGERSPAVSRGPGSLELAGERSPAASGVWISSDEAEERTYEVKEEEKGWKTPGKKKIITKNDQQKFMQSYSRPSDCNGGPCCNEDDYGHYVQDDGYWSDFIRRVPNWP